MTQQEATIRGLCQSLHSFANSEDRWNRRKSTGLNDDQLRLAIAEEFGIAGGAASEALWYSYQGGANPKFILEQWPDMPSDAKEIVIHGKELLFLVRQILDIPDRSGQMQLFDGAI